MNTKSKQLEVLIDTLRNINTNVFSNKLDKFKMNCTRCLHFDEKTEICKLAKTRPPAKIIAYGCEAFENEDNIPF